MRRRHARSGGSATARSVRMVRVRVNINPANGFVVPGQRTVANDADGSGGGKVPTVRANP